MGTWQRYLMVALAVCVGAFGVFSVGYALGTRSPGAARAVGGAEGSELIQEAYDRLLIDSVDKPDEEALARGAIRGMIEVLKKDHDPFALFYSPQAYEDFQELTTGRFSGIGVWLKERGTRLTIVSVLPGTPALEVGLERGDVITAVDGEPVTDMSTDEAIALIKGPEGSVVELDIDRKGESLALEIERKRIDLPNLQARLTRDGLGYLRLFGFARNAGDQMRAEIERLTEEGADGVILDLRDNGGGLFSEAIEVASAFIEEGPIVTYRTGQEDDIVYDALGDAFEKLPLVVLVNEGTASASEIVAGALQDRDRAIVIGLPTFGKGSVQEVVPLADASAMKFTTAAYLTPAGTNIDGKGIVPDVKVRLGGGDRDAQFQRAVQVLEGIVLSETGSQG